jgi:DNA adenine methylase
VEPFAGGCSVGLAVAELDLVDRVTLVEIDPDVAAVWEVILNGGAKRLANRIRTFKLDAVSARETLEDRSGDSISRAFRCLLLNRISRGGIMAPGAGWLSRGERNRGIQSRWYPETLARRVESVHALRNKITFVRGDGLEALRAYSKIPNTVAFVDPPYVARGRGAGLRLYSYHDVNCEELFNTIRDFSGPAIITYHRSDVVQREAKAAGIDCRTVRMHTAHTVSKRELILHKPGSQQV